MLAGLPLHAMAQYQETIQSGRPGKNIGGLTLGKQVVQLQTGYTFNQVGEGRSATDIHSNTTVLRFGLLEKIELSGLIRWRQDQIDSDVRRDGISNSQIGGRINLIENQGWLPTIGIQGRALLTAQSKPFRRKNTGSRFILATGNRIDDKLSLVTNWGLGWSGNDNEQEPVYFYNVVLPYHITDKLGTFLEMYGNLNDFTANFDGGFSYLISNDFQLDASAGWQGQNGIANWFVDAGISFRIDWRD